MSKFGCKCGHTIGFNVFPCRFEGRVIRDRGEEALYHGAARQVAEFIAAIQAGDREEWLRRFYESAFEITDAETIFDILTNHLTPSTLRTHQCERCGRLFLESGPGTNSWSSYLPEDEWRGVLETYAEGFVGYVAGQDFFGARIEGVRREEDRAWVALIAETGRPKEIAFVGVTVIQSHDGMTESAVRFLSEWSDASPLRRFVFDSTDQSDRRLLEITAAEVCL